MGAFPEGPAVQTGVAFQHSTSMLDMLSGAGPVVLGVLYLLLFFSIVSWGIMLYKARQLRQARIESKRFSDVFWELQDLPAVHAAAVELRGSPLARIFRAGYQELMRLTRSRTPVQPGGEGSPGQQPEGNGDRGIDTVERALRRAVREQVTYLERALTFLATTASTAPFVGLFGTVWGIMNAFRGLSLTRTSTIQAVAPGIAEALVATAIGLAAAIPSVVAYNHFSRRVRVLTSDMENFSSEFLNIAERHFLSTKSAAKDRRHGV